MKRLRFFSVIMVLALCFGVSQNIDAHKNSKSKETPKTENNQSKTEQDNETVFKTAAYMPSFPGGDAGLMDFISKNIKYPNETCAQGKVIVQFIVKKNGQVGEVKVVRSVDPDLDREAVRVCKMLPDFTPGRNEVGDPVNVWYTLPIIFKMQGAVEHGPTGDYAYDAKQVGEEVIKILMRDINSEEDIIQMEKDTDALQKKYEDFYKARGGENEWKKFNEELEKMGTDPVFSKRFEAAKAKAKEKAHKLFEK